MPHDAIRLHSFIGFLNLYLIPTPKGYVLVDTGIPGMLPWIVFELRKRYLAPEELAAVVLTHCHIDHMGNANALRNLGVPIMAHRAEAPFLRGEKPFPGYGGLGGRLLKFAEDTFLPPRPAFPDLIELDDDEPLLGSNWRVKPAPGHSPGSLALWNRDQGALVTGDTLVTSFGKPHGPHPLYTEDLPRAEESALRLLELEPKHLLPGHGPLLDVKAFDTIKWELRKKRGLCGHASEVTQDDLSNAREAPPSRKSTV